MSDTARQRRSADLIATEVLVIGSGIAGCVTALEAAKAGAEVTLIDHGERPDDSATNWAQGGIIYGGNNDSADVLAKDIFAAGDAICYPPAVRLVAENGPRLVKQILVDELGVEFDRTSSGEFDMAEEAAHSTRRIIHCKDRTGEVISQKLNAAIADHPRIEVVRGATLIDLLTLSHHSANSLDIYTPPTCVGAYVLMGSEGRVVTFLARETALATGGLGQLYLHTTNPRSARGDGIAAAYRAGARLLNLEYVQFHPTAFYHETAPRFLITEAIRGEGGLLQRKDGAAFMERHHPRGSLAPRDVVARAIHEELLASDDPCVYLDISHRPADWIRERFPGAYNQCKLYDIDITKEPIPVVPAAHYTCGGVAVDLESHTSIAGLRAIGEVACTGLHGANRLASTSLLECLVFGYYAGRDIAKSLREKAKFAQPSIEPWIEEEEQLDPALILQDWLTVKYTMWNYVGLVRTEKRLIRAKHILKELQDEIESFYAKSRLSSDLIGLRNGAQAALAVLYAAMENHHSRGCHYRLG